MNSRAIQHPVFNVIDLFSGAGGMSYGFHRHPLFQLIGSADAEIGKPSTGNGKLQCNSTYSLNIGLEPTIADLSEAPPEKLREVLGIGKDVSVDVLSACPPCTGFSRQNPKNHIIDDKRNSLVRKSALFAVALDASIVVMENARELIRGNFRDHYEWYREYLENHGYDVFGKSYMLTRFGLPQIRERAIIIAVKSSRPLYTLESLWDGWHVKNDALNVRHAFNRISDEATETETYPKFSSDAVKRRLAAIPKNGGSWIDLYKKGQFDLLTDSMKRTMNNGRVGSYPDVYGRMAWDKPAPTIKRECSHVGNGRYAHPSKSRLCSVREMAILQGFPNDFKFESTAVSNMYRHIGDAVPPLISYQIAHLCEWMRQLGPRVVKLDIKGYSNERADQNGARKGFADITDGDIDWESVREALQEIQFTGWVAAEVGGGDLTRLQVVLKQMKQALLG